MQHEVFVNPGPRTRARFPFVAVLQADIADEGRGRVVAPMLPREGLVGASGRLMPLVRYADQEFYLAIELMGSLPSRVLRKPLGSIEAHRQDIVRAIDWLFTGV